jgi:predicted nucleic acid-binding protein
MKLLINDANILIDIIKVDVVASFLALNFELKTTDFVFAELLPEQQKVLKSKKLQIIESNEGEDLAGIFELKANSNGISFEDCSVWYYDKKLNGVMVTGDRSLRNKVIDSGIEVRGIIFLIEEMKTQRLIKNTEAIEKLKELIALNPRLPKDEIEKRISLWSAE